MKIKEGFALIIFSLLICQNFGKSEQKLVWFDEFDGDYEELDLKLYRIKFINDVSN